MTQAAPLETKDLILDVSIGLMQRRGYRAVGMREIAEHVQVKAASLYHHFPSKEALAKAAMERYCAFQWTRLEELNGRARLSARLTGYAELFAEMLADGPRLCLYPVLSDARESLPPPCIEALEAFVAQNVQWLRDTLDEGFRRYGRPEGSLSAHQLAELIFGAFEGYMMSATIQADPAKAFRGNASRLLKVLVPHCVSGR